MAFEEGVSSGAIACRSIAAVAGTSILAFFLYKRVYRRKKKEEVVETSTLPVVSQHQYVQHRHGNIYALVNHLIDFNCFKRDI